MMALLDMLNALLECTAILFPLLKYREVAFKNVRTKIALQLLLFGHN